MSQSIASALVDRDVNAQMQDNNKMQGEQQQQQHKSISGLSGKGTSGAYVSPSDAILSPASQKLAGFKQRQINKQNSKTPTSRSLFSRTTSSVTDSSLEDSESINKQ